MLFVELKIEALLRLLVWLSDPCALVFSCTALPLPYTCKPYILTTIIRNEKPTYYPLLFAMKFEKNSRLQVRIASLL